MKAICLAIVFGSIASIDPVLAQLSNRDATETREEARERYRREYLEWNERVIAAYPEASNPSSEFSRRYNFKVAAALERKEPLMKNPSRLMQFADEVAEDLRVMEARAQAAAAKKAETAAKAATPDYVTTPIDPGRPPQKTSQVMGGDARLEVEARAEAERRAMAILAQAQEAERRLAESQRAAAEAAARRAAMEAEARRQAEARRIQMEHERREMLIAQQQAHEQALYEMEQIRKEQHLMRMKMDQEAFWRQHEQMQREQEEWHRQQRQQSDWVHSPHW